MLLSGGRLQGDGEAPKDTEDPKRTPEGSYLTGGRGEVRQLTSEVIKVTL